MESAFGVDHGEFGKRYELNNQAPTSQKRKYMAAGLAAAAPAGIGGGLMGSEVGGRGLKAAAKTKNFKVGAGLSAAGFAGAYGLRRKGIKDKTLVKV